MKEAIIVGLDGRYQEAYLVPDEQTGVTPLYEDRPPAEEGGEPTEIIVGYIVAEKVPEGLYQPRWDFAAYDGYQTALADAQEAYREAYAAWVLQGMDEQDRPNYEAPEAPAFWVEGLTQAEIDAIKNAPQKPSPEQRIAELEAKLAIAAQAAADANDTQQQLLDYLIETGVI